MKLTACSGVAARRSQITPSAIVRCGRCDGCTTETRLEYSDGCQAWMVFILPLPLGTAVVCAVMALVGAAARWSNSSSIEMSSSCEKE